MFNQPDLHARQARWLALLSEFNFEVRHIKGKENKVADALSRRIHGLFEMNISREDSDLEERIRTAGIDDKNYIKITKELPNNTANSDKLDLISTRKGCYDLKTDFTYQIQQG